MPQSLSDYDSQYLSSHRGKSFLPTSSSHKRNTSRQQPTNPSPLSQEFRQGHHHHDSASSTSTATSRSSTANSQISVAAISMKAQDIQPTSDVARWAHQTHLRQGRSYDWCQGCFPKECAEPLYIPKAVEKVVTGRRRETGAGHCYDI